MIRKLEKLAYHYEEGDAKCPTLVFLPGFRSDMGGSKAQYLMAQCKMRGQSCLLLDYSGHGQSEGRFEEGTIGQWISDAIYLIDHTTKGDVLLIGSSMGGWIGLQISMQRKNRIRGFIGIAAAPDFTRKIVSRFSEEQKVDLIRQGFFSVPSEYGDDLIITQKLLDDGDAQSVLNRDLNLDIPVILLQGMQDDDVPWKMTEIIKSKLPQAEIILIEDGDHRLSRQEDLAVLEKAVLEMNALIQVKSQK